MLSTAIYSTPPMLKRTPVRIDAYRLQMPFLGLLTRTVIHSGCTDENDQKCRLQAIKPEMYGCTDQFRGVGRFCHV